MQHDLKAAIRYAVKNSVLLYQKTGDTVTLEAENGRKARYDLGTNRWTYGTESGETWLGLARVLQLDFHVALSVSCQQVVTSARAAPPKPERQVNAWWTN